MKTNKRTERKSRPSIVVLGSYGLKLSCLKVRESDSGRSCTFDYQKEDVTQEDDENLEQFLFLLDTFRV